jgi:signal transduction histidine kinase/CheY-like chemotaxis protein
MNSKNKVIIYAIVLGVLLYILESLLYFLLSSEGNSFMGILIMDVPVSEIYGRMIMMAGIIIFGFIVSGMISGLQLENEFLKHQPSTGPTEKIDATFISSLAYQIKTPLNAIVGFSELLKDPNLSAQSKNTYISHINSSGGYLLQLINNVVDISKIESGQLSINKVEFRVNDIMEDLRKQFEEQKKEMGRAGVALIVKNADQSNDFIISTDKARFKQIMINLLENAFKHTEQGFVEFGYKIKEENLMEVYVKDSGHGFSMERLEIIFNRYKKLSDNQNQPFDGSALKLTISKNLIKLLGGNIWANSKIGEGSTFYFTLPFKLIDKPVVEKKEEPKEKKNSVHDWSNRTILIAEDVESNYIYLQELLRPSKLKLIWAKNGKEAVEHVKKNSTIELVLMDILMPEMDGYEASKQVKNLRPELPIIAQTAYSIESDKDKENLLNFDDYLIKPIWSPQLMSAMEKHLLEG